MSKACYTTAHRKPPKCGRCGGNPAWSVNFTTKAIGEASSGGNGFNRWRYYLCSDCVGSWFAQQEGNARQPHLANMVYIIRPFAETELIEQALAMLAAEVLCK